MQLLLLLLMLPLFARLMLATAWYWQKGSQAHRWETGHLRVVARGLGGGGTWGRL